MLEENPTENQKTGQPYILTTGVQQFIQIADLLRDAKSSYTTIGVITGPSGTGKTVAAQVYQQLCNQRESASDHSQVFSYRAHPHLSSRGLLSGILQGLEQSHSRLTFDKMYRHTEQAFLHCGLKLLIIDECDHLFIEELKMLVALAKNTGSSLLLIGLPTFCSQIEQYGPIASRVSLNIPFLSPKLLEVITHILPSLDFPGWSFHPEEDEDRRLGEKIWHHVHPSFRKLRILIYYASHLARSQGETRITRADIHHAIEFMGKLN